MAEENPDLGTITDEAELMDALFEEPGANPDEDVQAAQDAEVTDAQAEVAEDTPEQTAEPEQPAEPQKFTVKIDGKDESVTLDELLSGYQRQSDYTRKTQEVAEARKRIEAGTEELKAVLQQWAIPQEQEPDWHDLAQKMDPREYNAARAQWDTHKARSQQAQQLYQAIQRQEHSALLQREQAALLDRIPEWRDRDAARKDLSSIVSTAAEYGFSEGEIGQVTDHRVILMARELARLKGAQAALQTQKQATPAARVEPQGRARHDDAAERNRKLLDTLKRTGSDDAAMALIMGG